MAINQTVRWGLIGCGDIARKRVAPALASIPNSTLVAVARNRAELAAEFARQFEAKSSYADWHDLIADNEVNAVYIATPVYLHAEQMITAADAGKHVLCEKPMAMNTSECAGMIAAARKNKIKLGVAYYRHFYPVIDRLKEILASGEIGKPIIAQLNSFEQFNPEAGHPRAWLLKSDLSGGGPMMDFGCHRIEVLLNLFGPIIKTRSIATNALYNREVEDTATAIFEFESGMIGSLSVTHAAHDPQDTLVVWGSEGSVHMEVLNAGSMIVRGKTGERTESHPPATNIHQPLIEDFIDAVLRDREPAVSGEAAGIVNQIEDQIYCNSSNA
jgi:predicted dehydrogenase